MLARFVLLQQGSGFETGIGAACARGQRFAIQSNHPGCWLVKARGQEKRLREQVVQKIVSGQPERLSAERGQNRW